jgi:hypothetical protein
MLYRVPWGHGKTSKAYGEGFAVHGTWHRCSWQKALCLVPFVGHTAMCIFNTRQKMNEK